jgi:hypothetical protein
MHCVGIMQSYSLLKQVLHIVKHEECNSMFQTFSEITE